MSVKKMSSQVFEEIEKNFEAKRSYVYPKEPTVKISLKDMTQEEKIQEASKPLYLKRYE